MENKYRHLTATDRGIIEALLKENWAVSKIAQELEVNKSTVSWEITGCIIAGFEGKGALNKSICKLINHNDIHLVK